MSYATAAWNYPSPTITAPTVASTYIASPSTTPPGSACFDRARPQTTSPRSTPTLASTASAAAAASPTAKKKRSKMQASTVDLKQEDDWTKVKDPKEKKRIQNRVAQRTYRHRMKARLGELQARLDSHERRGLQQTTPDNSDSTAFNGVVLDDYANASHMPGSESSPSPAPNDNMSNGQMPLLQPNMYEQQPTDSAENTLFSRASRPQSSPPQSHTSPQAHGLLSPPGQPGSDRSSKVPQDFVLDCMRFQTQLLGKLNSLQQDPHFPVPYAVGDGVQPMLDGMSQADQVHCVSAFPPTNPEDMEFSFDGGMELWKTDAMAHKKQPSTSSTHALNFPTLGGATPTSSMGPTMMNSTAALGCVSHPMAKNERLDEHHFESIMEHAQALDCDGFDSFDALVTAYYCDTFSAASPLANEQRLSRNRRLPKVIGDVFQATSQWTPWERRGFQEEILKTTESMLISEGAGARHSLMSKISSLIESYDITDPTATAEALLRMKQSIQNELPNSWALTMALAAENRSPWQRDRSNTALAATLLLNYSGRMPNDQLLQIIGACL